MRESTRREHERSSRETDSSAYAAGRLKVAGGEATDPHQLVMFDTRVLADKAVAPYMGEVPWEEQ